MSTEGLVVGIGNRSLVIKVNGGFPPTPTSLVVAVASPTRLNLSWSLVTSNERSVKVERSLNGVSGWSLMATLAAGSTSYADTTVSPSTLYFYRVSTVNRKGSSAYATGNQTTPGTVSPPAAPSGLSGTPISSSRVNLSWTDNSTDETGFELYRSAAGAGSWSLIVTTVAGVTTYQDTGLTAGASYDYRVRAINTAGQSSYSTASGVTLQTIATPTGLGAVVGGSTSVALAWTDAATNETAYSVERSTTGASGSWTVLTSSLPAGSVAYNDTGLSPGTLYYWRVRATDGANSSSYSNTASATTDPVSSTLQVLPSRVAIAQAKQAANTAQWQSFKARLDAQLPLVMPGGFEGSNLTWVADYALGWQVTGDTRYGDKAVSLLLSAMNDYCGDLSQSRYYLARGTGSQTAFTLPVVPVGTCNVYIGAVRQWSQVRSASVASFDQWLSDAYRFIKISNTSDGPADYTEGVDWEQGGEYNPLFVHWISGTKPANGATYYITTAEAGAGTTWTQLTAGQFSISGTTLTLNTPPTTSQSVWVEYVYGSQYRQVGNGRGGWNLITIDAGYTARWIFYLAAARDWLNTFGGLDGTTKNRLDDYLVRWEAWLRAGTSSPAQPSSQGLYKPAGLDGLQSNYETGYYLARCSAAAALGGRNANATAIQTNTVGYRNAYVDRDLRNDPGGAKVYCSYKGGWNIDGLGDYGPRSNANIMMGSDILKDYALLPDISKEQAWAGEVISCIVHSIMHPTLPGANLHGVGTQYSGGNFGTYPCGIPVRDFVKVYSTFASDPVAQRYAAYYVANETSTLTSNALDLLYRDPSATAANWTSTEPLAYYASGTGLVISRAAWDYASTVYTMECGDAGITGGGTYQPGTIMAWRGADDLLVNATEFNSSESTSSYLANGNVVMIGTTMNTVGLGPNNHTLTLAYENVDATHRYAECDYLQAFRSGSSNPGTECNRVDLHLRPDYRIVLDRATTTLAGTVKQLQNYLATAPTRTGDAWVITRGTSKLFGKTFSDSPITSANDAPAVAGTPVNRITVNPTSAQASIRYVTVMQTAASSVSAMDTVAFIKSTGGKLFGAQIGRRVGLGGYIKTSAGLTGYQQAVPESYAYTGINAVVYTHVICDLVPGRTYTLTGANQPTATASAAGVIVFLTTGTGAPQTIGLA